MAASARFMPAASRRLRSDHQEHPAVRLLRRYLHRPQCGARRQRHIADRLWLPGSPNSQNRTIQEVTFGFNQTMWKNPRYGAINFMGQYECAEMRAPWYCRQRSGRQRYSGQHHLLQRPLHAARLHAELLAQPEANVTINESVTRLKHGVANSTWVPTPFLQKQRG